LCSARVVNNRKESVVLHSPKHATFEGLAPVSKSDVSIEPLCGPQKRGTERALNLLLGVVGNLGRWHLTPPLSDGKISGLQLVDAYRSHNIPSYTRYCSNEPFVVLLI